MPLFTGLSGASNWDSSSSLSPSCNSPNCSASVDKVWALFSYFVVDSTSDERPFPLKVRVDTNSHEKELE